MTFQVGDKVRYVSGDIEHFVTAIGRDYVLATNDLTELCWLKANVVKIADPPPAPPKPVPPACGYWKSGDVMLCDPVWRKVSTIDYWINESGIVERTGIGEWHWCLSVLTPPTVPACGYWESAGKRYKLADPPEYRPPKRGEPFTQLDGRVIVSAVDGDADAHNWILREVPSVKRWTCEWPAVFVGLPMIGDPDGAFKVDTDKIGREWAIKWAASNGQNGVVAMLKQEQEASNES